MTAQSSSKKKRRRPNAVKTVLQGSTVSGEFFRKYWLQVFLIALMFVGYITNKYQCQTRMETIGKLQKELEVVRTEHINQHSMYHSSIRESKMKQVSDSLGLDLAVQQQPPYRIKL